MRAGGTVGRVDVDDHRLAFRASRRIEVDGPFRRRTAAPGPGAAATNLTDAARASVVDGDLLLVGGGVDALLGRFCLRQLPVDVIPVEVAEERVDVLLASVRG